MIICKLKFLYILQNYYFCKKEEYRTMKTIILILTCFLSLSSTKVDNKYNNNDNVINKNIENEDKYDKLIEMSKQYINTNTKYAFNCVYKASVIAKDEKDARKSAECNIIMGNIFQRNKSYPNAISYYEKAISYLIELKEYTTIYKMYINIAKLYQNSEFDTNWSINAMTKALDYAKKTNDQKALTETHFAFADLYISQEQYEVADSYYDIVLKDNIQKNSIRPIIANVLNKKAYVQIKQKKFTEAMNLIDSSLYLCIRDFNDSLQITNYSYKAEIYDSLHDIENAKKYYKQAAILAYSTNDFKRCSENMYKIGMLHKMNNAEDKAIETFKILCDSTEKFNMYEYCYLSYYQLSQCYANLGRYEDAYKLFNKYDIFYDSSYIRKQEEKMDELRTSHLLSMNVNELNSAENKLKNNRNYKSNLIIFIGTLIALSIISITFIILYSKSKALFQKNKETTYEQQLKIDKMKNDLMEFQLRKNRESLINLALHLKSYIEFIDPLKDELKDIIESPEKEQKNKIKNIYTNMQNNVRIFNNTESLSKQINDIYKDFLNRLEQKHPDLTKSEKRLCAMLYIEMSSKEIAIITNTTTRSVETSRYRLRKKLHLSRDEDIKSFLRSI